MASSSYYHKLYKDWKNKMNKYDDWIKAIKKIEEQFTKNPVSGDPKDVNGDLKSAVNHHAKALMGSAAFTANASLLDGAKEPEVMSDTNMYGADSALKSELVRLQELRDKAKENKEKYWKLYKQALASEAKAAAEKAVKAVTSALS